MKNDGRMNVLYACDDGYARHMAASIHSLLEKNPGFEKICLYIIDNEISPENRDKLRQTAGRFANAEMTFIPFFPWKKRLCLDMPWEISVSAYARLFVSEMLPQAVERVLYMDCDTIVCRPLDGLWRTPLEGCVLAAVQDCVGPRTKAAVGLPADMRYFNSGLLLIDLQQWRARRIGERCLSFIAGHGGSVTHHDQGTLNGVLLGDYVNLPLRCNLMTVHYFLSREKLLKYYHETADFYSQAEIDSAKKSPLILHYTPSFTERPWCRGCRHPLRRLYWENLAQTPWKGAGPERSGTRWYVRLINRRYRGFSHL